MSFIHTWRRMTDNNYRWETAPQQAILDSQDDLAFEVWELRQQLAALTSHFEPTELDRQVDYIRTICERMGIDYDNL